MIRIATIFLYMLLAAAALGRYKAEVAVRETREQIEKLKSEKKEEARRIQVLRAEVAYLENPGRLEKIAVLKTDLRRTERDQLLSGRQFASTIVDVTDGEEETPEKQGPTLPAVAMAHPEGAQ